ncbi:MAG TPA: hypothetical protein VL282_19010 [Tepidisphaeraceae bacterium]|jgi:hypothetical protein|nr:hypothetical protein [Tepidisphaeraceae bacterium]
MPSRSSSDRSSTSYRQCAFWLTVISAFLIAFIGFAAELLVWHYDIWARDARLELTSITKLFLFIFGGYGHTGLWFVIAPLWLPMLYNLVRCATRYRDERGFALRFIYGFVLCWLIVFAALAIISIPLLAPLVILLADIHHRSPIRDVFPWIALGLLVLTTLVCARELLRMRRASIRFQHNCCPTCGYDLRASPGQCPECGELASRP